MQIRRRRLLRPIIRARVGHSAARLISAPLGRRIMGRPTKRAPESWEARWP